jgi:carbon monoxide dehydrogenase subunit G
VKARFTTEIEVVEISPPNRAKLKAHGTAPGSAVDVVSEMIISQNSDGSTDLNWTADIVVVGTIASHASRMMGGVTKKLTAALFDCVKEKIEE